MKNLLFALMLLFTMFGCINSSLIATNSGISSSSLAEIPIGAKYVIVNRENVSADSLYEEVFSILLTSSHRILKEDKVRHYITTEGQDVGQSTLQRMTIVITEDGNKAQLKITTEWKAGTDATMTANAISGIQVISDWESAKWGNGRYGIAFAESVNIANKIQNGKVSYCN